MNSRTLLSNLILDIYNAFIGDVSKENALGIAEESLMVMRTYGCIENNTFKIIRSCMPGWGYNIDEYYIDGEISFSNEFGERIVFDPEKAFAWILALFQRDNALKRVLGFRFSTFEELLLSSSSIVLSSSGEDSMIRLNLGSEGCRIIEDKVFIFRSNFPPDEYTLYFTPLILLQGGYANMMKVMKDALEVDKGFDGTVLENGNHLYMHYAFKDEYLHIDADSMEMEKLIGIEIFGFFEDGTMVYSDKEINKVCLSKNERQVALIEAHMGTRVKFRGDSILIFDHNYDQNPRCFDSKGSECSVNKEETSELFWSWLSERAELHNGTMDIETNFKDSYTKWEVLQKASKLDLNTAYNIRTVLDDAAKYRMVCRKDKKKIEAVLETLSHRHIAKDEYSSAFLSMVKEQINGS